MNKLEEILKIAQIHVSRIERAIFHINDLFPIDAIMIQTINEQQMVWIDLLVNRFGKLQDLLATKLIDVFLEIHQENIENLTMIDKLNKLERFGIITNAQLWSKMRQVRNHIAYEYPDAPALQAKYLNEIFQLTPQLLKILDNIKSKIR